jgi:hypothetical protein
MSSPFVTVTLDKHPVVYVTITTPEGLILDRFPVCHWQRDLADEDQQNVGSPRDAQLLAERVAQYVEAPAQKGGQQ